MRSVLLALILVIGIFTGGCGKSGDDKKDEKTVTVVKLSVDSYEMGIGEKKKIVASIEPSDAVYDGVKWSCDSSIATISNTGELTAISAGAVNVTTIAGNIKQTIKIIIKSSEDLELKEYAEKNIYRTNNSGLIIKSNSGKKIYIDPIGYENVTISEDNKADIIIVTHEHGDHYSMGSIEKISGRNTKIFASSSIPLQSFINNKNLTFKSACSFLRLASFDVDGVNIKAVAAYNVVDGRTGYHPQSGGGIGVIVSVDGYKIYHAGDTDKIDEMKGLNPDIAFLPVGGTYTMTAAEAKEAAIDMNARLVVPIHYADVVGSVRDAENLKELLKNSGISVLIKSKIVL